MLPALWLDEASLIPDYQIVTDFSRVHATYADKYSIPFVSASATVADGYAAYGLESVSESYRKFGNSIETGTTGSPHTLALYYMINETDALNRLNKLKQDNPQIETSADGLMLSMTKEKYLIKSLVLIRGCLWEHSFLSLYVATFIAI
ncbi:hypothetical protein [Vibrio taketomensis]|uniref:hypothetical protein n=1 Tax=Vibrio taketomensis TaxID=2572923 RepID=UPI00138A268C|nr:hypothetical protein [Vibrio taketomensis]